jgi:uridylate kinase
LILKHIKKGTRFFIVCGGGRVAREYMSASASIVKEPRLNLDLVGVAATRLNAELIRSIFGPLAAPTLMSTLTRKKAFSPRVRVIVSGGFMPGGSSDVDAVEIAKTYGVKTVINLTNVDFVYDKDPTKHKDARPLRLLSWHDYLAIIDRHWWPGMHFPFDPVAAKRAKQYKLSVVVANGRKMKNLDNLLSCKPSQGTIISG